MDQFERNMAESEKRTQKLAMDSIKKVKEIEKEKDQLIMRLQDDASDMRKIIGNLEDQLQRYRN